jgi:RNA polymerase sigma-70 factor (ECF subfamily)
MDDGKVVNRSHIEIEFLINRLKTDDLNALSELYEVFSEKIFRRCYFLLKDKQLAEDAVHDIFIKILSSVKGISASITFEAWLNRTVYNHCIDIIRKTKTKNSKDFNENDHSVNNLAEVIEEFEINEMLNESLRKKIDALNEIDRTILSLFYWEGYSVKEISEIMELSESAIKMRMKRSRDNLKSDIQNDANFEDYFTLFLLISLQLI